jgi:hypothetical protein
VFRKTLSRAKLMPFLASQPPYRQGRKNDGNDAKAIGEALSRSGMRLRADEERRAAGCVAPALGMSQELIKERMALISTSGVDCSRSSG